MRLEFEKTAGTEPRAPNELDPKRRRGGTVASFDVME